MSNLYVTSGDAYLLAGSDDRRLRVTVTKDGAAVDLTDTVSTFMVKRRRSDADDDALISVTATVADPQTGATKGVAYIPLTEADTADLDGRYLWELSAVDAVGTITLAAGNLYVGHDLIVDGS
jgi:hypothetical protein